jgi:hypothetical protein
MQHITFLRHHARIHTAALMFLVASGTAWADNYDPVTTKLTAARVTMGGATFFDLVVSVAAIVSGPTGGAANGGEDSYDTTSGQLTIPSVMVGSTTYHNVVATVGKLISIGGVVGTDLYAGTVLAIPYVQVGGVIYANVIITVDSIVSVGSGLPTLVRDTYDPGTQQLTIAAVQFGTNTYTNVVITVGTIVSVGGPSSPVTLAPPALSFNCGIGIGICVPESALLINSGTAVLSISSITLKSPVAGYGKDVFRESNHCPARLEPGQSCAITVSFGSPNFNVPTQVA